MKVAILGTKGIPNNYGGFEQFAEYLSIRLVALGHAVTVYNPSFHSFQEDTYHGVRIIRMYSPEKWIGGAANFIYDHLCLKHALSQNYDIIYEAGYHSVAASYWLLGISKLKMPVIITNMDGLEWKRSKWNFAIKRLIHRLESIAVNRSPFLISDNPGIRQYYLDHFSRDSFYLPYGADPVSNFDEKHPRQYGVEPNHYFLLIARMEPENNIDMILRGYIDSNHPSAFLVVGNYSNGFGRKMVQKYGSRVCFIGSIYNKSELDSLRHFSTAYFHGHSVGGTNPSLLEAMSCQSFILSHSNPFNKGVLGDDAIYFEDSEELAGHIMSIEGLIAKNDLKFRNNNLAKITHTYNWENITRQHEELFYSLLGETVSKRPN